MEYTAHVIDRSEAVKLSQQWIEDWGKTPIQAGMYGNIAMGVKNSEGEYVYVGFIWESPTEMAMIGFITRNRHAKVTDKSIRRRFIMEMIMHIEKLGYRYFASWCADAGLKKDFREIGCVETSHEVSEFFGQLKQ